MQLKRFSIHFNKENIPDRPGPGMVEAYMSLFCCLANDLAAQALPVTIRLSLEKQRLDYRIVADVTFEYSHCGRCGVELCDPKKADVCFYCIAPMCHNCWDNHGHCGHPEAVKMNEEARAVVQSKGAPIKEEQSHGQGTLDATSED